MDYRQEHEIVLDLVKEVGAARLGHWDGCTCSGFEIRGVRVDVACGKGRNRGIWITTPHSGDYPDGHEGEAMLRPIAEEVARQVEKGDCRGPIPIHFHEWKPECDCNRGPTQ